MQNIFPPGNFFWGKKKLKKKGVFGNIWGFGGFLGKTPGLGNFSNFPILEIFGPQKVVFLGRNKKVKKEKTVFWTFGGIPQEKTPGLAQFFQKPPIFGPKPRALFFLKKKFKKKKLFWTLGDFWGFWFPVIPPIFLNLTPNIGNIPRGVF